MTTTPYFLTYEQFVKCFPNCKQPAEWYNAIKETLSVYGITTKNQVVCFLAQCAHESSEFNVLRENLNYSADGLLKIFKKYFTPEQAKQYARQPSKIANRVYANRGGNGPEESGDGWKYRGVGIIQLTFKNSIAQCSQDMFQDDRLLKDPEILLDKVYATIAACWFWNKNKLNGLADTLNMKELTRKINGGFNGLDDRIKYFNRLMDAVK